MRRLPHHGARHGSVDHGDASDGVFLLLHLWVLPSSWAILLRNDLPPLSLACGWPLSANGSLSYEWWRLHDFRVEGSSGARKVGPNRPPKWARPAGFGRPAQTHLGSVRLPLRSPGFSCIYALCPSICTIFTMSSSRPRWRFSLHEVRCFTLQSSRMFLCNTSVLTTIGSDFIMLINMNKTP
jgi:hypothetical protein